MENNYTIHQVPHGYSFILGFYGRCSADTECELYDINQPEFRKIVDSVYQVDGKQSGTTFSWYKESLVNSGVNHFESLECGHSYYFVIKPGTSSLAIKNLYITNNSSSDLYKFDDSGRVSSGCEILEQTPTPTPSGTFYQNCCSDFSNSVITLGNQLGTENLNGIKTFGFEFGGMFCFDNLNITNLPSRFNFKTDDETITGYITTTGNFENTEVSYISRAGECYIGNANKTNGFNILTRG